MKKLSTREAYFKLKREKFTTFCFFRVYNILTKLLGRKARFVQLEVQDFIFEALEINGLYVVPEYESET